MVVDAFYDSDSPVNFTAFADGSALSATLTINQNVATSQIITPSMAFTANEGVATYLHSAGTLAVQTELAIVASHFGGPPSEAHWSHGGSAHLSAESILLGFMGSNGSTTFTQTGGTTQFGAYESRNNGLNTLSGGTMTVQGDMLMAGRVVMNGADDGRRHPPAGRDQRQR